MPAAPKAPCCPRRLLMFCTNLFAGLILGQVCAETMPADVYSTWKHVVKIVTMFHLSYIMINVGFEFEIDKTRLSSYVIDYLVAMTAATFPWIFCSLYLIFVVDELPWQMALVAARFAAPTSAGLLFTMLEAAGMKETWLYQKARILAIFDDLDTLILMVPLKAFVVGAQWELSIDLVWVFGLLVIMYKFLHRVDIPATWYWVAIYAFAITLLCEVVHLVTSHDGIDDSDLVDTVHLEILLPAFTIGCIVKHPHSDHASRGDNRKFSKKDDGKKVLRRMSTFRRIKNVRQESFKLCVSAIFMVLVGLNMPSFINPDSVAASAHRQLAATTADEFGSGNGTDAHGSTATPPVPVGTLIMHVAICSLLMNVGKMFPIFCYRKEVDFKTRLGLSFGMMPRGEVCAGIIVNAIALGVHGTSITIAVLCLAVNMTCVAGFIFLAKTLSGGPPPPITAEASEPQITTPAEAVEDTKGTAQADKV